MPAHVKAIAEQVARGRAKIEYAGRAAVPSPRPRARVRRRAVRAAGDRAHVEPGAHSFGWDVVLWNDVVPAVHPSPDELAEKMLPDVKRSYFAQWANQIAQRLHVTVTYFDKNLPLLESM